MHKKEIVIGDAAEEILKYISKNEIDCVIIGTHGKQSIKDIIFGSVASKIVRNSTVPVLTINPYLFTEAFIQRNTEYFKKIKTLIEEGVK